MCSTFKNASFSTVRRIESSRSDLLSLLPPGPPVTLPKTQNFSVKAAYCLCVTVSDVLGLFSSFPVNVMY